MKFLSNIYRYLLLRQIHHSILEATPGFLLAPFLILDKMQITDNCDRRTVQQPGSIGSQRAMGFGVLSTVSVYSKVRLEVSKEITRNTP